MKKLIVLDSSCWLEIFIDSKQADLFEAVADKPESLIVPVITIYEVVKKLNRERGAAASTAALSVMRQGHVVELSESLALKALGYNLPLADSLIYATAQAHGAVLWTQDQHFDGLVGVKYFPK